MTIRSLLAEAAGRAAGYLEGLDLRQVAADPAAVGRLRAAPSGPVPEAGCDPASVIAFLDGLGSPATVASAGARYFGFVTGGALPVSVAAQYIAAAWDQNAFSHVSSPAAALFEDTALRWVRELLGLPAETAGAVTTGATMANLACLAAARNDVLGRHGWHADRDGLVGEPHFARCAAASRLSGPFAVEFARPAASDQRRLDVTRPGIPSLPGLTGA